MRRAWNKLIRAIEASATRRAAEELYRMGYCKEAREIILRARAK